VTSEVASPEYPFTLITGRSLYQFNAGTMTGRTLNNQLRPADVLDMASVDAVRLGLCDGQMVRVRSRYGIAALPVCITPTVSAGQLFATFQTPSSLLNTVTGPNRDSRVGTPEYKVTAVQIEST
jgi:formate dehydrogenase major subunit